VHTSLNRRKNIYTICNKLLHHSNSSTYSHSSDLYSITVYSSFIIIMYATTDHSHSILISAITAVIIFIVIRITTSTSVLSSSNSPHFTEQTGRVRSCLGRMQSLISQLLYVNMGPAEQPLSTLPAGVGCAANWKVMSVT